MSAEKDAVAVEESRIEQANAQAGALMGLAGGGAVALGAGESFELAGPAGDAVPLLLLLAFALALYARMLDTLPPVLVPSKTYVKLAERARANPTDWPAQLDERRKMSFRKGQTLGWAMASILLAVAFSALSALGAIPAVQLALPVVIATLVGLAWLVGRANSSRRRE